VFFGYLISGIGFVMHLALNAYLWIVIAGAFISWVNPDPYNPVVRFLRIATEPVFYQIRRRLPFLRAGTMDFSPIVVIAAIYFLDYALAGYLIALGARLKMGF
jgi:YggT family protein